MIFFLFGIVSLIKRLAVFNASSPVGVLTDSMIVPLKLLIQALEFILLNSSKLKVILNRLNDMKTIELTISIQEISLKYSLLDRQQDPI